MIDFSPLTLENFPEFEEHILESEKLFPADIRETSEGYRAALLQRGAIGLVARLNEQYAGNILGFSPCEKQRNALRLDELPTPPRDDMIYLFNIVAMPEFQSQGLGRKLLGAFLDKARNAGYRKVGGHFRGNGSLKNFKTLGGQELAGFDNWFDTGERYTYCELELDFHPAESMDFPLTISSGMADTLPSSARGPQAPAPASPE